MSAATGLVSLYQVQYDDLLSQFFGVGMKINEQHRPLLTPDEVRLLGADSVIIFSANVPPIHATRLDPGMFNTGTFDTFAVQPPPVLSALEWTPLALPRPNKELTAGTEASAPPAPSEEEGAWAEPEF